MPGWVTTAQAKDYLEAHLAHSPENGPLASHWDAIVGAAVTNAYWTIVSAFALRGYTKAQTDDWDRGAEFQKDIAVHVALKRLAVIQPDTYGSAALDAIDRRPELYGDKSKDIPPVPLTILGVPQDPEGTWGQVTTGPMDTTDDLFVVEDPDDSRIGETTRF